ncbi:MAG: polysaccharide biosynthesis tyrosine autokinase [Planctomycetes bacterium]|nr:polysaccharide biosynthesis tyrosine autokinase [Planctomycetota bacterium]
MRTTEIDTPLASESGIIPTGDLMVSVLRFMRMVRLRKHVVLSTLYVFFLLGAVYYFLAPRLFESSARILIVDQPKGPLETVGSLITNDNTMTTHRELVVSPVVIQRAIQLLDAKYLTELQDKRPQKWVESIALQLRAAVTRKTNIIDVSYRSQNPEAAAAIVRAIIQAYLDFVDENHKGTAGEISSLLTEKRDQIQETLITKQRELQRLRQEVGHLSVSSDDQIIEPMIQRALSLNEALLNAQEKRVVLQATLTSVEEAFAKGEDISQHLMGIESIAGQRMLLALIGMGPEDLRVLGEQKQKLLSTEQEIQGLRNVYGPNHPHMQELRQKLTVLQQYLASNHMGARRRPEDGGNAMPDQVVLDMLRQSVVQAKQVEKQLNDSYVLARSDAAAQSGALLQLRTLEREVARTEALSDSLIVSIAEIDMRRVQAPIKATVVREPLAEETPVSPQLRFVAFVCIAGGLMVGGLIVYVQDFLDDRFSSPEELSAQLQVPILSIVRKLDPLPGSGLASIHTFALPNSVESEAFRTLRTTLSVGGDVHDRLLISSAEPGDGKTTVAANLSVAFAQAGKKTLVIDADLRRPGLSVLLGLKGQQGVADLLASEEPVELLAPNFIHRTELDGLDILPVGLRRPNPAELLSGKAFVDLLAWADSLYDRVIVDCPPVLAVSDAQIVGQSVDGAILVVRPDKNHRRSVIRAVESFQVSGCQVVGVVANGISNEAGGYGYGFGYGYGYGYSDGYGHEDVVEDPLESDSTRVTSATQSAIPNEPGREAENKLEREQAPFEGIRPRRAA